MINQLALPDPAEVLSEPLQVPIAQQFLEQAARTPHAPAIEQGTCAYSYAQLAASAVRIAHTLGAEGIAPREVVGVSGARSFGFIAGLLGTLLSGAVMLPLDPNLPPQRRQAMLSVRVLPAP